MRLSRIIVCSALLALALAPATAVAQGGTTTSAGDQQYVDPLTGTTTSAPATSAPSPAPAASSSGGSTSGGSTSGDSSSSASPATSGASGTPGDAPSPSTAASGRGSGSTLPFTGLNLSACVAVGIGMLGAGLVLRRVVRRA